MQPFLRGAVGQVGTPKMGVTVERPKLPVERPVSQFKSPHYGMYEAIKSHHL